MEDKSFNAFLKAKLEEDVTVPAVKLPRKSVVEWRRPLLLAASVVIACGVFIWQFVGDRVQDTDCCAEKIIDLFSEGNVDDLGEDESSFADKLLAWQDAPFAEIEEM